MATIVVCFYCSHKNNIYNLLWQLLLVLGINVTKSIWLF